MDEKLKIHLPEDQIDEDVQNIANKMADSNVFNNIRLMPDCHMGSGCCIGMTDILTNKVIPQIVGGDIGCGIAMIQLDRKIKEKNYEKIDKMIKEKIPMGACNHPEKSVEESVLDDVYNNCNNILKLLKNRFENYDFSHFEYNQKYYKSLKKRLNPYSVRNDYLVSMGTLGGGNHYIEFNVDDNDIHYLTVHCGSRHLGQAICNYHQSKVQNLPIYEKDNKNDNIKDNNNDKDNDSINDKDNDKETQNLKNGNNKNNFFEKYLEGNNMIEYLIDMVFAQEFAKKNRHVILEVICEEIGADFNSKNIIESVHNYIDFNRFILRKGAISAEHGEQCLIALNMRDGILLCKGKGNRDWNYSCAHGCGRIMSRRDARNTFTMRQYKKEMKNVFSTCIVKDTLDEIPNAYKDAKQIQDLIIPSVEIIKQLKPILNIKGF